MMTSLNKKHTPDCECERMQIELSKDSAYKIVSDAKRRHLSVDDWFIDAIEKYLKNQMETKE